MTIHFDSKGFTTGGDLFEGTGDWNTSPFPGYGPSDGVIGSIRKDLDGDGSASIVTAASYDGSGASGGRGFRSPLMDAGHAGGGSIRVSWTTALKQFYTRFYVRYQLGTRWASGVSPTHKILYANSPHNYHSPGLINGNVGAQHSVTNFDNGPSWYEVFGLNGTDNYSHGQWVCLEFFLHSGDGDGAGEWKLWVNNGDVNSPDATMSGLNHGTHSGLTYWDIASNRTYSPAMDNGGVGGVGEPVDFDIDEIVVSDSFIGPLGGSLLRKIRAHPFVGRSAL